MIWSHQGLGFFRHANVHMEYIFYREDMMSEEAVFAGVTQLVEYRVPNAIVVGSNPIARLTFFGGPYLPSVRFAAFRWRFPSVGTLRGSKRAV